MRGRNTSESRAGPDAAQGQDAIATVVPGQRDTLIRPSRPERAGSEARSPGAGRRAEESLVGESPTARLPARASLPETRRPRAAGRWWKQSAGSSRVDWNRSRAPARQAPADAGQTDPTTGADPTTVKLPPLLRDSRYLVVDCDTPGSIPLPSGDMGRLLGAFQTLTLAEALASAERLEGHRVLVFDSRLLPAMAAMRRQKDCG